MCSALIADAVGVYSAYTNSAVVGDKYGWETSASGKSEYGSN